MKKLIFILSFLFIFTSSASATIFKWVDEKGVVNYTDDYSNVSPGYRNKVEEVNIAEMGPSTTSKAPPGKIAVSARPGGVESQAPPPIDQTLIREGDFAVKLTEALKLGQAKSEAEAEDMLTSAGIAPKNGWIADYPVTPDIIGELQSAIRGAADSGKLAMNKDEAIKALQDLIAQQGLPVRADTESRHAGAEPPVEPPAGDYGEYSWPEVISNYYSDQGPPIVTYYPPPWEYYYLYAWVPYPFWYSGFWFRGFYCLHDFHRPIYGHGGPYFVSNHYRDHGSQRVHTVDPVTRHNGRAFRGEGDLSHGRGFRSAEARNGAASIYGRSYERSGHGNAPNGANSTRLGGRFQAGHSASRGNSPAASNSRTRGSERPSGTWGNRGVVGPHGSGGRPSSQQRGFEGHSRASSTGGNRSFTPPSMGSRSSSGSSFRAPSTGGRGSFGGFRDGGYSGGFHGGSGFGGSHGGGSHGGGRGGRR